MYLLPLIFSLLSMFSVATYWTPRAAVNGSQEKQNDTSIVDRADAYRKAVVAADIPAGLQSNPGVDLADLRDRADVVLVELAGSNAAPMLGLFGDGICDLRMGMAGLAVVA